jgi:hypothetical protein
MVLVMVRGDAGPRERWPRTLKRRVGTHSRKTRDVVGKLA